MTDKNLTDNEILKALEICSNDGDCNECKINPHKGNYGYCTSIAIKAALDLINRQQEEIEKLTSAINGFRGYEDKIKAEAYKECIEKVEEIICDNTYPDFDINHKAVNIWKAEAYKNINNLLKEMESKEK